MFSTMLNKLLDDKQFTAYKLSKALNISQGLMSDYKNGIRTPTTANLIKIADYFNVSVDYLLGRTDENYKPPKNVYTLSDQEQSLIEFFRQLPKQDQSQVERYSRLLVQDNDQSNVPNDTLNNKEQ